MPTTAHPRAPENRHWLDSTCSAVALLVPLCLTLFRAAAAPGWRDDLSIIRGLGLIPVGTEGRISSVLTGLASLLPIGGRWLRASWVGGVALALASYLAYRLARRVLEQSAVTPRLTPALALAAALTATLAPGFQLEGTLAGGAAVAVALVLGAFLLGFDSGRAPDARAALALGALFGLTLCEAHGAALALLVGLAVHAAATPALPRARALLWFGVGAGASAGLCLVPLLVRPLATRSGFDLGHELASSSLVSVEAVTARTSAVSAWLGEVGVVSFALAVGGLALGLIRRPLRPLLAPLGALVLADLLLPGSRVGVLIPDAFGALRLLALVSFGIASALAVQSSCLALTRVRIPFAEPACVLLVVFDFTLVFVGAEDSAYAADRRSARAAEIWTDEALAALPPDALVLVRSEALAFRFLATRVARGERPDVVVVPVSLLDRGNMSAALLRSEPALLPLIRERALSGRSSEYALSSLAAARPLFVELEPRWEHALLEHLEPTPFFMRFAPEPLARSDRAAALKLGRAGLERVVAATAHAGYFDMATRAVLVNDARERALVLVALGDRKAAEQAIEVVQTLDADDALARELALLLHDKPRGPLNVAGLLP